MKRHLDYPNCSVYDHLKKSANEYSSLCAVEYYGNIISYRDLLREVNRCACALAAAGVRKGDSVSICLPNIPQAVYLFYAVNKLGAVANMIHPLSAEKEILDYITLTDSRYIFAIDLISEKLEYIAERTAMKRIVTVSAADEMSVLYKTGYRLKSIREHNKKSAFTDWKEFISKASPCDRYINAHGRADECAAILYSGGTTGKPKGIMLTNLNFNALALQSIDACGCLEKGDRVLSVMPIFHGFGLGVCIHTVFTFGGTAVMMPRFKVNEFDKLILRNYPNVIAGVPAIYEAMLRSDGFRGKRLDFIKCVISGGDSLSPNTKKKLNDMLRVHGCECTVREGYGLTECVTGSCLTPEDCTNIETCGKPYADTFYKIIDPESSEELPQGETGEIILRGPTVMKGYYKEPDETAETLSPDKDGIIWLHTGDLGSMDENGYVYFRQRLKRMIVTNGYNIYPQNIENVISSHKSVVMCAVVGIPDEMRGQIVKAFVMLSDGASEKRTRQELEELLSKNIAAYALPKEIRFVNSFPKTLVGKIAYNELIAEELKNGRE
ncbi:MAG: acyl--CoA ligase [Ruminococcus sp.]|uniref:class I adenylate-forming enzyme family protein n=1 Tax=Ruminococcus sp. TaxID=41978 RepID=UPI0025F65022|nr:class I adenylate-forming enzyme family protein [Ruminococcus sp.]MCR5601123.1 acyl--CoA ligase [Ruminococcus sp.]